MSTFSFVEQQAMQLSPDERELLALRLVESIENSDLSDVERSWLPIIEERYKKFLSGEVEPIPVENALDNIQKELGWRK